VLRNQCGEQVVEYKPGRRAILGDWLGNLLTLKGVEKNLGTYIEGLPAKADAAGHFAPSIINLELLPAGLVAASLTYKTSHVPSNGTPMEAYSISWGPSSLTYERR
jgi:hypothetical protein